MSTDLHKLKSALKSIEKIEHYTTDITFEQFMDNVMIADACLIHFINLGERLSQLSENFKETHQAIPYDEARQLRNWLAHQYDGIHKLTIWKTIQDELPQLKLEIKNLILHGS